MDEFDHTNQSSSPTNNVGWTLRQKRASPLISGVMYKNKKRVDIILQYIKQTLRGSYMNKLLILTAALVLQSCATYTPFRFATRHIKRPVNSNVICSLEKDNVLFQQKKKI